MATDGLTAGVIARLRQAEIQLRHLPLDEFPETRHQLADWIADGCNACEQMAQENARVIERQRVKLRVVLGEVVAYIRLQYPGVTMDGSHVPPSAKKVLALIAAALVEKNP